MTVFKYLTNRFSLRFFVLILALAVIFKACSPDFTSEIGSGLQPEDEFIGAHFNNTHESLRLVAYTIADLPGVTSGRSFFALGSFNDPNFGTVSIDLISQVDEMFRWDSVRNIHAVDSVVIFFTYHSSYPFQSADADADFLDPITISIGELNEPTLIDPLTLARTYFSDDQPRGGFNDGSILANFPIRPNLRDSVPRFDTVMQADTIYRIDTVMLRVPTFRIPLHGTHDNPNNFSGYEFGRRLLETTMQNLPRTADLGTPSFLGQIHGLYFRTHPETSPGRGNIVNFDFTNNILAPQIRVYYRFMGRNHDDSADSIRSTAKLYSLGFWDGMTYNRVNFDRTTASQDLRDQLDGDITSGRDRLFLQAFFGTLIRVEMPDIRGFTEIAGDSMRMVINQASLVLNPIPNGDRRFLPIPSLGVAFMTDTLISDTLMLQPERYFWRSLPTRDQGVGIPIGGSGFVERRNEYRIVVTRHIQHLLTDPDAENLPLTIFPINRLLFPDITAIAGPPECPSEDPASNQRMRLEIVYSLIPK